MGKRKIQSIFQCNELSSSRTCLLYWFAGLLPWRHLELLQSYHRAEWMPVFHEFRDCKFFSIIPEFRSLWRLGLFCA